MSKYVFILLAVFSLLASCGKEKFYRSSSEITGKWEVSEFISLESMAYLKDDNYSPVIEFNTDGTYRLTLDVNWCAGTYTISDNYELNCSPAGCTKMCCDSPFSKKLSEMLPRVSSFEIQKNELKLHIPEWGWINLRRTY